MLAWPEIERSTAFRELNEEQRDVVRAQWVQDAHRHLREAYGEQYAPSMLMETARKAMGVHSEKAMAPLTWEEVRRGLDAESAAPMPTAETTATPSARLPAYLAPKPSGVDAGPPGATYSAPGTAQPEHEIDDSGPVGFGRNMAESWRRGDTASRLDTMAWEASVGLRKWEDVARLRREFELRQAADPIAADNWLSKALHATSAMAPAMGKGYAQGAAVGAAYAAGAVLLGQLVPGYFDEAALAGAAVGVVGRKAFSAGMTHGAMQYWFRQGAGAVYATLMEEGVDPRVATVMAQTAGVPYALVEFMQVSKIFPGLKSGVNQVLTSSVKKTATRLAKEFGTNWAEEVTEEVIQAAIEESARHIGKGMHDLLHHDKKLQGESLGQTMATLWDTARESALPLLLAMGPNAAWNAVGSARKSAQLEAGARRPPAGGGEAPVGARVDLPGGALAVKSEGGWIVQAAADDAGGRAVPRGAADEKLSELYARIEERYQAAAAPANAGEAAEPTATGSEVSGPPTGAAQAEATGAGAAPAPWTPRPAEKRAPSFAVGRDADGRLVWRELPPTERRPQTKAPRPLENDQAAAPAAETGPDIPGAVMAALTSGAGKDARVETPAGVFTVVERDEAKRRAEVKGPDGKIDVVEIPGPDVPLYAEGRTVMLLRSGARTKWLRGQVSRYLGGGSYEVRYLDPKTNKPTYEVLDAAQLDLPESEKRRAEYQAAIEALPEAERRDARKRAKEFDDLVRGSIALYDFRNTEEGRTRRDYAMAEAREMKRARQRAVEALGIDGDINDPTVRAKHVEALRAWIEGPGRAADTAAATEDAKQAVGRSAPGRVFGADLKDGDQVKVGREWLVAEVDDAAGQVRLLDGTTIEIDAADEIEVAGGAIVDENGNVRTPAREAEATGDTSFEFGAAAEPAAAAAQPPAANAPATAPQADASAATEGAERPAAEPPAAAKDITPAAQALRAAHPELWARAAEHRRRAAPHQDELNSWLDAAVKTSGAVERRGALKSIASAVEKVLRHKADPAEYGPANIKDHVRGTMVLRDWTQAEAAARSLAARARWTPEVTVDEPLNKFGYRGVHLTTRFADGTGAEVQLHTPESWAVKEKTDPLYRKWRTLTAEDEASLTAEQKAEYKADVTESRRLWRDYWAGVNEESRAASSAIGKGLESVMSPTVPRNVDQRPVDGSRTRGDFPERIGSSSRMRPSDKRENRSENSASGGMGQTPSESQGTVARNTAGVKGTDTPVAATVAPPASPAAAPITTPAAAAAEYRRRNDKPGQGSAEGHSIQWASEQIEQTARRLARTTKVRGWVTLNDMSPKNRDRKRDVRAEAERLKFLRTVGYADMAWDANGDTFHALAGTPLPATLTREWSEEWAAKRDAAEVAGSRPDTNELLAQRRLLRAIDAAVDAAMQGVPEPRQTVGGDVRAQVYRQLRVERPFGKPGQEQSDADLDMRAGMQNAGPKRGPANLSHPESLRALAKAMFIAQAEADGLDANGILGGASGLTQRGKNERLARAADQAQALARRVEQNLAASVEAPTARTAAAQVVKPTAGTFVTDTNGGADLGRIEPDAAAFVGQPAAPIRIRQEQLPHLAKHDEEVRAAGYADTLALARDVADSYQRIHAGRGNSLILAKSNGKDAIAYVELTMDEGDGYYSVKGALVARSDYLKGKPVLWERAQSSQTTVSGPPSAISGQSADLSPQSIPPAKAEVKAGMNPEPPAAAGGLALEAETAPRPAAVTRPDTGPLFPAETLDPYAAARGVARQILDGLPQVANPRTRGEVEQNHARQVAATTQVLMDEGRIEPDEAESRLRAALETTQPAPPPAQQQEERLFAPDDELPLGTAPAAEPPASAAPTNAARATDDSTGADNEQNAEATAADSDRDRGRTGVLPTTAEEAERQVQAIRDRVAGSPYAPAKLKQRLAKQPDAISVDAAMLESDEFRAVEREANGRGFALMPIRDETNSIDGFVNGRTIFVRRSTRKPLRTIVRHEMAHGTAEAQQLAATLDRESAAFKEYHAALGHYTGARVSPDHAAAEMACDILADGGAGYGFDLRSAVPAGIDVDAMRSRLDAGTAQARAPPAKRGLNDFGEKLGGARKDMAPAVDREITDGDLARMTLAEIWPKTDIDAIEDKADAAVAHAVRALVPAKPRLRYKLARWIETVKLARALFAQAQRVPAKKFIDELRASPHRRIAAVADKIELLRTVERATWARIGDVIVRRAEGTATTATAEAEVDGRWVRATDADALAAAVKTRLAETKERSALVFEVRLARRGTTDAIVVKKGDPLYRPLKTFSSATDAHAFIRENRDALVRAWEDVKSRDNVRETDVRRKDNRPRTGKDHRQGRDATPEKFLDAFGFRGVEFGNWVAQGGQIRDRQGMLNAAYDALMDLADVLGIPPRAIALNGTLGLGLGSRGHGWASAHYEPGALVINLTKTRGAGSLAHEWFHALDHYFQRERTPAAGLVEGRAVHMTNRPDTHYQHKTSGYTLAVERFAEIQRQGGIRNAEEWELVQGVRPEVEAAFAAVVRALDASPMRQRSERIDKGQAGGYWGRIVERAARAFESYVIAKMQQAGYQNDYLANVVSAADFARAPERYPYLLPSELAPVERALDDLFGTVRARETEQGVVLFSVAWQDDAPRGRAWPEDFPRVTVMSTGHKLRSHPDFAAAKAGDAAAAQRAVMALVKPEKARELAARFPGAILMAAHAEEASGRNAIPRVLANYLGRVTGLRVAVPVVQTNRVGHTGATMDHRMAFRPRFSGPVEAGQSYILLDDVVTSGSSLAELRDYVESHGGHVVAMSALSAARFSSIVAMTPATRLALERMYDVMYLNAFLREYGIHGGNYKAGTETGTEPAVRTGTADAARDRRFAAGREAPGRVLRQGVHGRSAYDAAQAVASDTEGIGRDDDYQALTEAEARWFLRAKVLDAAGDRILAARREAHLRVGKGGLRASSADASATAADAIAGAAAARDVARPEPGARSPSSETLAQTADGEVRFSVVAQAPNPAHLAAVNETRLAKAMNWFAGRDPNGGLWYTLKHLLLAGERVGDRQPWLNRLEFRRKGEMEAARRAVARSARRLRIALKRLNRTVANAQDRKALMAQIEGVLKGEVEPAQVRNADQPEVAAALDVLAAAREEIDRMSAEIVGMLGIETPGALQIAIIENMGRYVVRPYMKFLDPHYRPAAAVRAAAHEFLLNELDARLERVADRLTKGMTRYRNPAYRTRLFEYATTGDDRLLDGASQTFTRVARRLRAIWTAFNAGLNHQVNIERADDGSVVLTMDPEEMSGVVTGTIDLLLLKDTRLGHVIGGQGGSQWKQIQKSLIRRKDIPAPIRELFGEVHNVAALYQITALRQRQVLIAHRYQAEALAVSDALPHGHPNKVFYTGVHTGSDGRSFSLLIKGPAYGPLGAGNGVFTDRATYDLMAQVEQVPFGEWWMKAYTNLLIAPRYAKTVLSATTWMRNFATNFFFALADGELLHLGSYAGGWRRSIEVLFGNTAEYERLMTLGLVSASAHAAELKATLTEAFGSPDMVSPEKFWARVQQELRKGGDKLAEWYALGDNIHKMAAFYSKTGRGYTEDAAIRRVRSSQPYYDMAPLLVTKGLRRMPLAPDFITFPIEVVRCSVNNYRNAIDDLKTRGDPAAVVGTILAHGAATATGTGLLGWALASALSLVGGGGYEPPDEEERRAAQQLLPDWQRINTLLWWRAPNGTLRYMDYGYIQPYDLISTVSMSLDSNRPAAERLAELRTALWDAYTGVPMGLALAGELAGNRDQRTKQPIVAPGVDTLPEQVEKMARHVARRVSPGMFLYLARAYEVATAGQELETPWGEIETVEGNLKKAVTPVRVNDFAPDRAFEARAREVQQQAREVRVQAGRVRRRRDAGFATDTAYFEAEDRAYDKLGGVLTERMEELVAAGNTFLGDAEMRALLRGAGWTLRDIDDIFSGAGLTYYPVEQ